jgi:hypothetical protein
VIKKALMYAGIGSACLIILLGSSALLYKKYLQHRVAVAHAIQSPPGIDSLDPVQIGRIEQWIEVQQSYLAVYTRQPRHCFHTTRRRVPRAVGRVFHSGSVAQERPTLLTLEELVEQTSR